MTNTIKILLADDHTIIREGLKSLFEKHPNLKVVGEASSGIYLRQKALFCKPDVVLMDISMPDLNGMAATRLLKQEMPDIRVIGLSVYTDRQFILGMLGAGAEGYLAKSNAFKEVISAIRHVMNGHIFLGHVAKKIVFQDYERFFHKNQDIKNVMPVLQQKLIYAVLAGKDTDQISKDIKVKPDELMNMQSQIVKNWISMT